jgi:hypothetical protein
MNVILLGSILFDATGRPLGPYRLRTACENAGYSCKVIDYASSVSEDELKQLISKYATSDTLVLGISNVWFSRGGNISLHDVNRWFTEEFFAWLKTTYPNIKVVIGGTKPALVRGSPKLLPYTDWWLVGFADIGFIKLLDHVSKKASIRYTVYNGVKMVDCNVHYPVVNTDEIETVFKQEDGFKSWQPITLEASRGCIFKCAFCTHPFLGKKSYEYIRSVESIASEFKRNYELFGTTRYIFSDDTLNDSMEKLNRIRAAIDMSGIPDFEFCSYIRAELLVSVPDMIPALIDLNCRGGHLGLESLGAEARRAVGKGMDIERVMEALAKWKRLDSNLRLNTGMIVGLPGDSLDDCYKFADRFAREGIIDEWTFQQLGMIHDVNREGLSDIDKNPEKYGYTITRYALDTDRSDDDIGWNMSWINNAGITSRQAKDCSTELNQMHKDKMRPAGFRVASMWYHHGNSPTMELDYKRNPGTKRTGLVFQKSRLNRDLG